MFDDDAVYFTEKRVRRIGAIDFFIAFAPGGEQAGFFQSVEFEPDAVRRLTEFAFQAAQIRRGMAVEKKLQQQLDARFGRNECVDHVQN